MKKRILYIGVMTLLAFGLLCVQLIRIQILESEDYSKHRVNLLQNSVNQRVEQFTLDSGRGGFLDRFGHPLSFKEKSVLVMFPFVNKLNWPAGTLASILGVDEHRLKNELAVQTKPFVFEDEDKRELTDHQIKQINDLKIPGIIAVRKREALQSPPASHLLGTLTLNKDDIDAVNAKGLQTVNYQTRVGKTGMEKVYEDFLQGDGSKRLIYHKAANGLPLFGVDIRYVDDGKTGDRINIQTTMDRDIQQLAEKIADHHKLQNGGLIVLDIETNDLVAIVSKPDLNSANIENKGNRNQMLLPQVPGSVFKTVVAAAALEENIPLENRVFNGNLDHLDRPLNQDNGRMLGQVNFRDGFAYSSNQVFGMLARELKDKNPDLLERYSEKLGLISLSGWEGQLYHTRRFQQLPEEKLGVIWSDPSMKKDNNYVANTAIGQLDVKFTPLSIANMMATIARGGERRQVRTAMKAVDDHGLTIAKFPPKKQEGVSLSPVTASKLQQLLRGVVTAPGKYNTAGNLRFAKYTVAGKSGTAEIGEKTDEKKQLYNKWFAGYFPFEQPKYALVAVSLHVQHDQGAVTPLFYEMVNGIYEIDQKRKTSNEGMSNLYERQ